MSKPTIKQDGTTCIVPAQRSSKELVSLSRDFLKEMKDDKKLTKELDALIKKEGKDSPAVEAFLKENFKSRYYTPSMKQACSCSGKTRSLEYKSNWGTAVKATAPLGFIPIISWPLGAAAVPLFVYAGFRGQSKAVPDCVSGLPLETFTAKWVGLSDADALGKVKTLKRIDIPNNNLTTFPDISGLDDLDFLNLQHNMIPQFKCGDVVHVKKPNKKFNAKEMAPIRVCMAAGNKLRYGKKGILFSPPADEDF